MGNPSWVSSQKSHIWIFNVGRGLCIFIRTALNQGIIYDFGSSEDFNPSEFLQKHIIPYLDKYKDYKLAQRVISHPHADHISNITCLKDNNGKENTLFAASLHTCPHHKTEGAAKPEAINWNRIKNPNGSENNIEIYKSLYEKRSLPLQTIRYDSQRSIPNLEYGFYYVRPPVVAEIFPDNDQEYGNGISLVIFYRHGFHTLLIPGDINPDTLKHLLDEGKGLEKRYTVFDRRQSSLNPTWHEASGNQPSLKSLLGSLGLSILLAPHHGLKSGFSEDIYRAIKDEKPGLVVISEKRHLSDTDGEVDPFYQSTGGAKGQKVYIEGKEETRCSVSTRDGHHILILFQGTGGQPEVYLEKDPEVLLKRL
jgi:beta-lactamase superfamily II metal-dependent hydrolase